MLDAYPHATVHRHVKPVADLSQAPGMSEVDVPPIAGEAFVVDPQFNATPWERLRDGIPAGPSSPRIGHFRAKISGEFAARIRRDAAEQNPALPAGYARLRGKAGG